MDLTGLKRLALVVSVGLVPVSVAAQPEQTYNSGAYLAAQAAGRAGDFAAAVYWYENALSADPADRVLLENLLTSYVGLGDFDKARGIADRIATEGYGSQLGNMVRSADIALRDDWPAIFVELDEGRTVGPLIDALARGWAHLGKGEMTEALAAFDTVIETRGLRAFGLYHKALALAAVGDFEGADAILSMPAQEGFQRTRRAVMAHIEVLSQLDRNPDAVALMDQALGTDLDPSLSALRDRLVAGEPIPFSFVNDARSGMAEVYFSVAGSLLGETDPGTVLMYARIALALNPDNVDAMLIAAEMLGDLRQYDLANAVYSRVPASDPAFHAAELGRADALRQAGQPDAAIEVLTQLTRTHPDLPQVEAKLGDLYRRLDRMEDANAAYTRALSMKEPDDPATWYVRFSRAITYHRLDDWPNAEADLRAALELNPGQPQVLNYLGYSMVELGENLDEALAMIEQAVASEPGNGAIVDSLGWVYYRLNRFPEAVIQLERAAALEPVDAVVNDHLGDAYWAVGRKLEAQFQWNRALSFAPEERDAIRIRRKLEVGLDAVLAEEGSDPLAVAQGG